MCNGETEATATAAAPAPAPRGPPHVALLSSPGMGHVAPLAELARRLHDAHGFTATVFTYASSDSAAQRALLASLPPAVGAASLPPVPLADDDLPAGAAIETLLSVEAQRSVPALAAALADLRARTNLVAFVADLFGADTLRAARGAGVPGYLFFPSNLLMLSLMLHLPRLDAELAAEFRDRPDPVRLPGCVPLPGADVLQPLQDRASDAYRWMVHHGARYRDAAGILVNTFDAAAAAAAASNANPGESYYDGSRSADDPLSFLPAGFVEETTTKAAAVGHVVPSWAPQTRVLAHRATAAMLTHCGWNSALESMANGVPMIAWPLYAEQRQNAVLLCEEAQVALRPRVRGPGGMVLADDVAEVVKEMAHGEKGAAACAKVVELQVAATRGLQPGGASYETLAHVVSQWTAKGVAS